jgi:hypothetical protein
MLQSLQLLLTHQARSRRRHRCTAGRVGALGCPRSFDSVDSARARASGGAVESAGPKSISQHPISTQCGTASRRPGIHRAERILRSSGGVASFSRRSNAIRHDPSVSNPSLFLRCHRFWGAGMADCIGHEPFARPGSERHAVGRCGLPDRQALHTCRDRAVLSSVLLCGKRTACDRYGRGHTLRELCRLLHVDLARLLLHCRLFAALRGSVGSRLRASPSRTGHSMAGGRTRVCGASCLIGG